MSSNGSDLLSQVGLSLLIKTVRLAFEGVFYGLRMTVNVEKSPLIPH